jgi:hypothetical protein
VMEVLRRRKGLMIQMSQPHHRPNHDNNKKKIIWVLVLLLLSVEVLQLTAYISYFYPSILRSQSDLFWQHSYHLKMYDYYYFKYSFERVAWILRMIAITKIANLHSTVLFLGCFVILCHMVFDFVLFWVNNNTWVLTHEFEAVYIYVTFSGLMKSYKPDAFARIRSIF